MKLGRWISSGLCSLLVSGTGSAHAGGIDRDQHAGSLEYELIVVPPLWDGSTSTSIFTDVLDSGLARGSSTVRIPRPDGGGFRIIDETITWSDPDDATIRPGLSAFNNRGDEVITAPNGDWATIEFADGTSETIFAFPGDVAIRPGVITEDGLVAGCSVRQGSISQGTTCVGFFWTRERGMIHLRDSGLVPEAVNVRGANTNGELVGVAGNGLFIDNQAFYFDSRADEHIPLHPLLVSPGTVGVRSEANDINDLGIVTGWRDTGFGGDRRGFTWSRSGGVELLPPALTNPRAINNDGVVVGQTWRYTPGEGLADLRDLADTGTFTIADARDISDTGVIVGWGWREGSSISTAFMLVPLEGCVADLTGDGVLDLADVQAFVAAFISGDSSADIAPPAGVLDLADVQAFVAAFFAGCS